jgi:hypothetical protein
MPADFELHTLSAKHTTRPTKAVSRSRRSPRPHVEVLIMSIQRLSFDTEVDYHMKPSTPFGRDP